MRGGVEPPVIFVRVAVTVATREHAGHSATVRLVEQYQYTINTTKVNLSFMSMKYHVT